mmetsp:Transcript_5307/g.17998  ORF Transcript_5307/g.17998 Transcript_5307/m.17998 type:complete len:88 (+) Transcript_5307:53-316(+)
MSQNGTYIDGTLIGRGFTQELHDGARIDLVFASPRPATSNPNHLAFPSFYFASPAGDAPPSQEPHGSTTAVAADDVAMLEETAALAP